MDLALIFRALWRHKWIMVMSVFVALWLAFGTLYQTVYDPSTGRTERRPREYTTYETIVRLILDTPNFGLGQLGLARQDSAMFPRSDVFPRTVALAKTYSYMLSNEEVMAGLKKKFKVFPGTISAIGLDDVPVIEVTIVGKEADLIRKFASAAAKNFIVYIKEMQAKNNISSEDQVLVKSLGPPTPATPLKSRKWEITLLVFLSPVAAGAALAFVIENQRNNQPFADREAA